MTISAEIIAKSKFHSKKSDVEIVTFRLNYPRIIHSELMTHRVFSRNAPSSRAIPIKGMIQSIRDDIAMPVSFGKNQPGMQAREEHRELIKGKHTPEEWWKMASESAIQYAEGYEEAKYHKQVANRLIEPYQHMQTVVTATSFDNWFWLRNDADADPTIQMLSVCMLAAVVETPAVELNPGEWHVPFYFDGYWMDTGDGLDVHSNTLAEALKISTSCCAQTSYRKSDASKEKAEDVYGKMINGNKVHASPFEHQATPMEYPNLKDCQIKNDFELFDGWVDGVTHIDKRGDFWSGNFKHWIQHRQYIHGHVCESYNYDEWK